jgi:transposase
LVALSPHHGYTHAKQAVAHAGLAPAIRESGQWTGKTRLAKNGDPRLRKALYMPALVACAAMRKLIHLAFAILKSGKPFDPNFSLA